MKILLEVKDNKGAFIMELLSHFKFVKSEPLTDSKQEIIENLKEAIEEMNLILQGKKEGRDAQEFLDELRS